MGMSIRFNLWLGAMTCAAMLLAAATLLTSIAGLTMPLASVIVLALFGPVAWLLARLAYAPVREVTRTARKIVLGGELDSRCFYPGPLDDVGKLVVVVNEVLVRYDAALARIIRLRAAPPSCDCPRETAPQDAADLVLDLKDVTPQLPLPRSASERTERRSSRPGS
jgi:hypothetical protein